MDVLDALRGRAADEREGDTCRIPNEHDGVTYTVSRESHDVAYAVVVREAELDALEALIRAERETPYGSVEEEGEVDESVLEEALESVFDDGSFDPGVWRERMRRPRRVAEAVLEAWRDLVTDEVGIGYLPIGTHADLAAFVAACRHRHEREHDPFELPEDAAAVGTLVSRIKRASERGENRVVVNRRHLPEFEDGEGD